MFKSIVSTFHALYRDTSGVTLIEYGIAVTLAILVGVLSLTALSSEINIQLGEATSVIQ